MQQNSTKGKISAFGSLEEVDKKEDDREKRKSVTGLGCCDDFNKVCVGLDEPKLDTQQ